MSVGHGLSLLPIATTYRHYLSIAQGIAKTALLKLNTGHCNKGRLPIGFRAPSP